MTASARILPVSPASGPESGSNVRVIDLTVGQLLALLTTAASAARAESKPDHYTVVEASQLLRCSERQVRRLIAQRRIRPVKVTSGRGSSRVLIPRAELEKLLSAV